MGEIVALKDAAANFQTFFETRKGELARALPRAGITADRLLRVLFTATQKQPDLFKCDLASVYKCVLLSAQAGLLPDGITGQAHIIPFKNGKSGKLEAQLILGYRGYLALARRSGEVDVIAAHEVREGDEFVFEYGTNATLRHVPSTAPDRDRKEITHFYATAKFRSGSTDFEVMTRNDVDTIRARARAKDDGPWVTDYAEMGKKTAIRRLCKRLPQSEDSARLLELDAKAEGGLPQDLDTIQIEAVVTDAAAEEVANA